MQAILIRIGVDHSYGGWNAPADPETGQFVYVPIPEKAGTAFHLGCGRPYQLLVRRWNASPRRPRPIC